MAYIVRKGVRADVPVMVQMQIDMAWETEKLRLDPATLTRGMTLPFERPNVADYYVVEETQTHAVVAMLMTTQEWSDWRAGSILWVQSVFVAREHRRKGLFTLMYKHLHAMVQASDYYKGIRLYVETENKNAQAAYKKLGMEIEHYYMMKWVKGKL